MTGNEKLTIRKNPTRTTVNKMSFEGKEFKMFPCAISPKTKYSKADGVIVKNELMTKDETTTFLRFLYIFGYDKRMGIITHGKENAQE